MVIRKKFVKLNDIQVKLCIVGWSHICLDQLEALTGGGPGCLLGSQMLEIAQNKTFKFFYEDRIE